VQSPQPGQKKLLLDIYDPQSRGAPQPRTAVVLIHGGGFSKGSRENQNIVDLAQNLAGRGFFCVSIDYRLEGDDPPAPQPPRTKTAASDAPQDVAEIRPESNAPARKRAMAAAVEDAAQAIAWLRENAKRHRIDPERIAVGGSSAGAITALLLGYGPRNEEARVAAVISVAGSLGQRTDRVDGTGPPLLIIHGTRDETVPFAQAELLAERAKEVKLPYEFIPVEGAGHGVPLDTQVGNLRLYGHIHRFLATQLRREAADKP
jgi:acetyl esterase/lipase